MTLSRIVLVAITMLALAVPARAQPLPWPQITYRDQYTHLGDPETKVFLNFVNGGDYDPSLFDEAPSLPSCDMQAPASRTWFEVREYGTNRLLSRRCHFEWTGAPWWRNWSVFPDPFYVTFFRPHPETATMIYLVMWDRATNRRAHSGPIGVPVPLD